MRFFVGIDIGKDDLKVVVLKPSSNRSLEVVIQNRMRLSDVPLSSGEASSYYHAVKWLLNKYEIPKKSKLCITFPSSFFYSKRVHFPSKDPSKVQSMLRYEIEKFIPGQLSEFIWDSVDVSHVHLSNQTDVLFCALEKEKVSLFFQGEEIKSLNISAVEVVPLSILRVISYLNLQEDGFYCHVDEEITSVMMIANGGFWVHTIPIGYCHLVDKIADHLSCDQILVEQTLSKNLIDSMEDKFVQAYRQEMQIFWNEIHEIIQFYRQDPLATQIHHMVVCGYLATKVSFREILSSYTSLLIEPLNISSKLVYSEAAKLNQDEELVYTVATGNALRVSSLPSSAFPYSSLSLLPEDIQKDRYERSLFYGQIVSLFILIVMIICTFYFFNRELSLVNQKRQFVQDQTQLIVRYNRQYKSLEKSIQSIHQARSFVQKSLSLRLQPIDAVLDVHEAWSSTIHLIFMGVNLFSKDSFQLSVSDESLRKEIQPYLSSFSSLCIGYINDSYGALESFRLFLSQQERVDTVTVLVAEKEIVDHQHRIYFILGIHLTENEREFYLTDQEEGNE